MFSVNTTNGLNTIGGYVVGIFAYSDPSDADKNIFDFDLNQYDLSGVRIGAYRLGNNCLEFDNEKYQELLEEEQRRESKPTWNEKIESQVYYTALMTDTLVEE